MEVCRRSSWLLLLLGVSLLATTLQGVQGEAESEGPSESECRPYIEKALKELETGESGNVGTPDTKEDVPTVEVTDDSDHQDGEGENDTHEEGTGSIEDDQNQQSDQDTQESAENTTTETDTQEDTEESLEQADEPVLDTEEDNDAEGEEQPKVEEETVSEETAPEETEETEEETPEAANEEAQEEATKEEVSVEETKEEEASEKDVKEEEPQAETGEAETESVEAESHVSEAEPTEDTQEETEDDKKEEGDESDQKESVENEAQSVEEVATESVETAQSAEEPTTESAEEQSQGGDTQEEQDETSEDKDEIAENKDETAEDQNETAEDKDDTVENTDETAENQSEPGEESKSEPEDDKSGIKEEQGGSTETKEAGEVDEESAEKDENVPGEAETQEVEEGKAAEAIEGESVESATTGEESVEETPSSEGASVEEGESAPVEDLSLDVEIPDNLRDRLHVEHLLKIDEEASEAEKIINRVAEITLKELKRLYENAIKPLEVLYKYRDLSNRHFGDAEIFSKPLILFMGPWSGGKSSIINYLVDNEYNETSLRTGAEPSPAYFNILMYGEEYEVLDGTQLAADFTFSGLQKFGQGLEERLRGVKIPSKLLEKVNIVEIPGILEVRKQVSRVFPFNDACQWFIDRADIIFLVYDPSKLDVGPETEAILDQLKGREHQTRIILNKADQVKPEELMRVQGALIWNISPLMSSAQPPVMYTTSLWSRPYESWAPVRLLQAQERAFLRDLRSAIDKRIENKIASARRFAVRVRNHAKMVDCYLTTYYNHKSVFGNRKQVADTIIEHPQDYHIYEGLSTLTNISRYDLPDPEVYKDFFKLNALYDFQQLSATCTYFRGCPINRLDVAIAYDLPELVGKHKRLVENALAEANQNQAPVPGS